MGPVTLVSVCERLLIVWRGICSTHAEVGCVIVAIDIIVCLLVVLVVLSSSGGGSMRNGRP